MVMKTRRYSLLVVLILLLGSLPMFAVAQDGNSDPTPEATIELTGAVTSINGTTIVVSGLPVDISGVAVDGTIEVGVVVRLSGYLSPEGTIIALSLEIIGEPTPTPDVSPTPASTLVPTPEPDDNDTIIVIQGPIQNITVNIITIYNIDITVAPDNPILTLIQIGDIVRIEGLVGLDGIIQAIVINNLSNEGTPGASVGMQGAVESINGNIVVINGIQVQLSPDDPILTNLKIGDFLDVQGNFVIINNVYVLVVIQIIVINNIDINVGIPPYCWYHADGMGMGMGMGHWHCDGMGMSAMGMGMGP